jgi:UDP-N-acetylglucosamine diphosphorylase/glucosamine-1-phosphate N-acetyltransferase
MKAVILAAGKGKRLQSEKFHLPKVLREALGKPLISYVLENVNYIDSKDVYIVVGYMKDEVMETLGPSYNYASQDEQLGTGHAVMMTEPMLKDYDGDVLVLYGDMPLFRKKTYQEIVQQHEQSGADCTVVTAIVENPPDYGRIIRDAKGDIIDIVEKRDCTPEQVKITELNVGIYMFKSRLLFESLKQLNNNNAQKEYYLTDVPKIMIRNSAKVKTYTVEDESEIFGVNTMEDLELCERLLNKRS